MSGAVEEVENIRRLHDPAGVHHDHPVTVTGDDPEVVGDQDGPEVGARDEVVEKLEDLGLDRYVERRRRFVGDQDAGLARHRHCDHHPLTLAAAQAMGVLAHSSGGVGDADGPQEFDRALATLRFVEPDVERQHLLEVVLDGQHGVQRSERVLRDHADLATPELAHFFAREADQFLARRRRSRLW